MIVPAWRGRCLRNADFGTRRARYSGLANVHLKRVATASARNLEAGRVVGGHTTAGDSDLAVRAAGAVPVGGERTRPEDPAVERTCRGRRAAGMDGTDQDQGWNPGRRLPIGAEARPGGGVHFRVWAPRHPAVAVEFDDDAVEALLLAPAGNGYYSGTAPAAGAGTGYRFRLGDGKSTSAGECASRPTRPRGSSPRACTGRRRWSIPRPTAGPTATGAGRCRWTGR